MSDRIALHHPHKNKVSGDQKATSSIPATSCFHIKERASVNTLNSVSSHSLLQVTERSTLALFAWTVLASIDLLSSLRPSVQLVCTVSTNYTLKQLHCTFFMHVWLTQLLTWHILKMKAGVLCVRLLPMWRKHIFGYYIQVFHPVSLTVHRLYVDNFHHFLWHYLSYNSYFKWCVSFWNCFVFWICLNNHHIPPEK